MLTSICLPHVFNQHDARLKQACKKYYYVSRFDKSKKKDAKDDLNVALKLFFEGIEMLGQYNFDRTKELLQWIRDNPGYPQTLRDLIEKNGVTPNCQQLAMNYIKFSGNITYQKKWLLLGKEVIKPSNYRKAKKAFGPNADVYDCCIQFVRDKGLEKFWDVHKEFMRNPEKEEKEKTGISISDELLVMAGGDCRGCEHRNEENIFKNYYLQVA